MLQTKSGRRWPALPNVRMTIFPYRVQRMDCTTCGILQTLSFSPRSQDLGSLTDSLFPAKQLRWHLRRPRLVIFIGIIARMIGMRVFFWRDWFWLAKQKKTLYNTFSHLFAILIPDLALLITYDEPLLRIKSVARSLSQLRTEGQSKLHRWSASQGCAANKVREI